MRYITLALFLLACLSVSPLTAQVTKQDNNNCKAKSNIAGDEKSNTLSLYQSMKKNRTRSLKNWGEKLVFPIRVGVVQRNKSRTEVRQFAVSQTIDILNEAFEAANIEFYIAKLEVIQSDLKINDLSMGAYEEYDKFSKIHDDPKMITLFLFDYDEHLCKEYSGSVSCGRTGGFSYILSNRTNNIVLSKFDLEDHKVVVHEFGHFFGLYHTFEQTQFGKEDISGANCDTAGDMICDTPADPGPVYEVYVNYSKCEMVGYNNPSENADYTPQINNFMSYYKPCFMEKYTFTPNQLEVIRAAATSDMRRKFAE